LFFIAFHAPKIARRFQSRLNALRVIRAVVDQVDMQTVAGQFVLHFARAENRIAGKRIERQIDPRQTGIERLGTRPLLDGAPQPWRDHHLVTRRDNAQQDQPDYGGSQDAG
jgi:hypothetical protein